MGLTEKALANRGENVAQQVPGAYLQLAAAGQCSLFADTSTTVAAEGGDVSV